MGGRATNKYRDCAVIGSWSEMLVGAQFVKQRSSAIVFTAQSSRFAVPSLGGKSPAGRGKRLVEWARQLQLDKQKQRASAAKHSGSEQRESVVVSVYLRPLGKVD